jgi:hypothetical protein
MTNRQHAPNNNFKRSIQTCPDIVIPIRHTLPTVTEIIEINTPQEDKIIISWETPTNRPGGPQVDTIIRAVNPIN